MGFGGDDANVGTGQALSTRLDLHRHRNQRRARCRRLELAGAARWLVGEGSGAADGADTTSGRNGAAAGPPGRGDHGRSGGDCHRGSATNGSKPSCSRAARRSSRMARRQLSPTWPRRRWRQPAPAMCWPERSEDCSPRPDRWSTRRHLAVYVGPRAALRVEERFGVLGVIATDLPDAIATEIALLGQ